MTAPGITLPSGRFYPHSFDAADLAQLETFLLAHEQTLTLAEVAAGNTNPRAVAVRHDVDHSIEHALRFARWEAERGIRSSYFILPTSGYWPCPEEAREIAVLGHEVGLHCDAYRVVDGDPDRAIALLREQADEIRSWGIEVVGCVDHGGGAPSNPDLWKVHGREPADAGFAYEGYALMGKQPTRYSSDNHGKWASGLTCEPGKLCICLIHWCHWPYPAE